MNTPKIGRIALVCAALSLSGCSAWDALLEEDGETENADDTDGDSTIASFDDQAIQALDFMRDGESLTETADNDMPTSGSVAYDGVVGFSLDERAGGVEDYDIFADATMEVDFDDGDITGSFDNFNTFDDTDMDGELTITEGTVNDNTMSGNAIGSFVDGSDATVWDLAVEGAFLGPDGSHIYGTADGTISNGGSEQSDVFGDFAVSQN